MNPKCPHCGYEFDDDQTWYNSRIADTSDGAENEGVECSACGGEFVVRAYHTVIFECLTPEEWQS